GAGPVDDPAVNAGDDVAAAQARRLGRRAGGHVLDHGAAHDVDAQFGGALGGQGRPGGADAAAHDLAGGAQLVDHEAHDPGRDGEGDAVVAAAQAARENGGVDADEPAPAVEQGAARVAAVHRRVGLDVVLDRVAHARAAETGDDAHGQGLVQAQRIADREGEVAGAQ